MSIKHLIQSYFTLIIHNQISFSLSFPYISTKFAIERFLAKKKGLGIAPPCLALGGVAKQLRSVMEESEVEERYSCAVCCEVYKEPTLLPCQHRCADHHLPIHALVISPSD